MLTRDVVYDASKAVRVLGWAPKLHALEGLARFAREARIAVTLNHVNIVQIYELGRVAAEYFISMEYIEGRDIRRILRHAMQVLGTSEATTVHVGDSRTDVEAARTAGVTAWAVTYGYNGGKPVATARPNRLFDDLGEVAAFALLQA